MSQHKVLLLLRSLEDFDLGINTSTGNIRRQALGGEGPTTKLRCEDCHGEGTRRIRGVESPCESCGGSWLQKGRYQAGRGWNHVDAYTGRKVGSAETELVSAKRRVRCDACGGEGSVTAGPWSEEGNRCGHCNGSGTVDALLLHRALTVVDRETSGDPRLDAMLRRRQAGSYDELLVSLGKLRVYALGWWRAVAKLEADTRTIQEARYDLLAWAGLGYLAEEMLKQTPEIRVPRSAYLQERRLKENARKAKRRLAA